MSRQAVVRASFALLGGAVLASAALAHPFPSKLLNVVVPYPVGGASLLTDIARSAIDAAFFPLAGPAPGKVREGKVRALGSAEAKSHPLIQAVPSISAHTSFHGFDDVIGIGVQERTATPDGVIDRINTAMNAVLQNADVRKGLEGSGSTVAMPLMRAELDRLYASEIERYRNMASGINLTPQ